MGNESSAHYRREPARSVNCRPHCGACCIALSISSPIPLHPNGKPAGLRCGHLGDDYRCGIFHDPRRPTVCARLRPMEEMCGPESDPAAREYALTYLAKLECDTVPFTRA